MPVATARTVSLQGMTGHLIDVQADVTQGVIATTLVGRPDASINRTVELPFAVDPQSAEANYEKGVLTIRLHRPKEHRPNKVQVRAG